VVTAGKLLAATEGGLQLERTRPSGLSFFQASELHQRCRQLYVAHSKARIGLPCGQPWPIARNGRGGNALVPGLISRISVAVSCRGSIPREANHIVIGAMCSNWSSAHAPRPKLAGGGPCLPVDCIALRVQSIRVSPPREALLHIKKSAGPVISVAEP
jgi:hypothetical protein